MFNEESGDLSKSQLVESHTMTFTDEVTVIYFFIQLLPHIHITIVINLVETTIIKMLKTKKKTKQKKNTHCLVTCPSITSLVHVLHPRHRHGGTFSSKSFIVFSC